MPGQHGGRLRKLKKKDMLCSIVQRCKGGLSIYESYPHLIQVQAFPFSMKLSAFAADPGIRIDGWESLRKTPYRVEYLRGSKLLPKKLAPLGAPEKLSSVTHWVQGLKKLMAGRTDIFLEA
jgi:hypothetical protein